MSISKIIICCLLVSLIVFLGITSTTIIVDTVDAESKTNIENSGIIRIESPPKIVVKYTSLIIPNINSSFKTYMDYRCVTNKNSAQYQFIHKWGWVDNEGFMRCNGEKDLGIQDNYYLIALGSYYGTEIGTKYRVTTDMGNIFYAVLADCKSDKHTNSTHQYGSNKDIIEFLVDCKTLNKNVKYHGSANVYMPLNGSVAKIERIDFIAK